MSRLAITHETRYEYDREVSLGEWRLMLRPTDSHALRVVSAGLQFSPEGSTRWAYDAFGNSVCFLNFAAPAAVLSVRSQLLVDRFPNPVVASPVAEVQTRLPVRHRSRRGCQCLVRIGGCASGTCKPVSQCSGRRRNGSYASTGFRGVFRSRMLAGCWSVMS